MNHSNLFADRVLMAFQPTARGVVGLVDDLLGLCRLYQLRIDFREGHCFVRRLGADVQDTLEIEVPKSVFRAALARVAAICGAQHPESVTPYGGEGAIDVPPPTSSSALKRMPPSTCSVSFTNTPSDQRLEMRFSSLAAEEDHRFTVLLRDKRMVTVMGHALKYVENASNKADHGSYGILSRTESGDVLVGLFPVSEVIGVFTGELSEPGEITK